VPQPVGLVERSVKTPAFERINEKRRENLKFCTGTATLKTLNKITATPKYIYTISKGKYNLDEIYYSVVTHFITTTPCLLHSS
jgi:hypothetical protein